jgi:hypothetical protein
MKNRILNRLKLPPAARRLVLLSVIAGLCLLLSFHFLVVVAHNSPPNPVKMRHALFINNYVNSFFAQDWHLFSPSPISYDVVLLVKSRIRHRATGEVTETDWVDITTPLLERMHEARFSSLGSLVHIHVHTLLQRNLSPGINEYMRRFCEDNPDSPNCNGETPEARARNENANRLMTRVASAHAHKLYGASHDVRQVKVRILINKFPRFSQRAQPNEQGEFGYRDFEWMAYQPTALFR